VLVAPAPAADAIDGGRLVTTWSGGRAQLCLLGAVDVVIDWGDGSTARVQEFRDPDSGIRPLQHTFLTVAPTHQVTATGTFDRFGCSNNVFAAERLRSVDEWGATGTTHADYAVAHAVNVGFVAEPPPTVTSMRGMFLWSSFNQPIGHWDTSRVTDMSGMFNQSAFNQPIGAWDTSQVTTMNAMFDGSRFNRLLGEWDTSRVTDMSHMFARSVFNQPIGAWDTSSVTEMWEMFSDSVFNRPLEGWDTSGVTTMSSMFAGSAYDQPLGSWDTGNVTGMAHMFRDATAFNRDLSGWCVAKIDSEPEAFDDGATAWVLPRPVWGTCDEPDLVGPSVSIAGVRQSDGLSLVEGFAADSSGVARVLCAIQDRSTGQWLHRDRSWGAYQRLRADLVTPGATSTKWRFGRRLPTGSYTVKAIGVDVPGNVTPSPRPFQVFDVP